MRSLIEWHATNRAAAVRLSADGARQGEFSRSAMDLAPYIRAVPDFPKPGILFRDITPLLRDPRAFGDCIEQMAAHYRHAKIDVFG